jgi:hypothetical protein
MSKINRHGSNQILSTAVEYHNFVFCAGITADDLSLDVTGQTVRSSPRSTPRWRPTAPTRPACSRRRSG